MTSEEKLRRFEELISPHLGSAFNLARWLVRDNAGAEDVVQEASLRAFRSFEAFRGVDGRPWLLSIVRNTAFTWMRKQKSTLWTELDDTTPIDETSEPGPEALFLAAADREMLRRTLEELPVEFREVIVLRELEEMSYKEIAGVTGVPLGTVMSRLSRGRDWLKRRLTQQPGVAPPERSQSAAPAEPSTQRTEAPPR